jgi:hypothetical protein
MPFCTECGYVTWDSRTCPTCGSTFGKEPGATVRGEESRSEQGNRVALAAALNLLSPFAVLSEPVAYIGIGANLAAAVLWFRAGADQLRHDRKGASTVSSLMVVVSLLLALGCLFVARLLADL